MPPPDGNEARGAPRCPVLQGWPSVRSITRRAPSSPTLLSRHRVTTVAYLTAFDPASRVAPLIQKGCMQAKSVLRGLPTLHGG